MLQHCPKCGLSFCDCVIDRPPAAPAPKPERRMSNQRELELRRLLDELRRGIATPDEIETLYKQAQLQMHVEIELMKELSSELARRRAPRSFDDFPLK